MANTNVDSSKSILGYFVFLCAISTGMLLSNEARFVLNFNILFAEATAILFLFFVILQNRGRIISLRYAILSLVVAISMLVSFAVSTDQGATLTAMRNLAMTAVVLIAALAARFSLDRIAIVYGAIAIAGVAVAVLGLHQSLVGMRDSIDLFELGLVPELNKNVEFARNWKFQNLQGSMLFFQEALPIGLHQYSNNFAEFLVYSSICVLVLLRADKLSVHVGFAMLGILFMGVLFSQSRTSQLGLFLIILYFAYNSHAFGSLRKFIIPLASLAIFSAALAFIVVTFGYDSFGTVRGRADLNLAALKLVFGDARGLFFAGDIARYYTAYRSDPHSMWLYMALFFGPWIATLFQFTLIFTVIRQLLTRSDPDEPKGSLAMRQGAIAATGWFILYGLTWSVVSDALSGMTWALIAGLALAHSPAKGRLITFSRARSRSSAVA